MVQIILSASLIGIPMGYAFQRTHLCFNSAYRELILNRKTLLLRIIALAIVVQMVALGLLIQFGIAGVKMNIVPFFWLASMIGGFIFGISMVYAEGCSSTVWYRVGTGNLGSLVTLLGFAIGEWLLRFGLLNNTLQLFHGVEIKPADGSLATLPNILQINSWLVIIPLVILVVSWLFKGEHKAKKNAWGWQKGGLVLGLIGLMAWIFSTPSGWSYGVGVVGGTAEFIQMLFDGPGILNWGSFFVLTLPVGAYLAARKNGELRWQIPDLPSTLRMFSAGLLMGLSATLAGGCNIGHGFSGLPTLALSSITATLFTFLGAWFGNYLRFIRA